MVPSALMSAPSSTVPKLEPSRVISHRVPLDEAPDAYRIFDAREAVKVLLKP